MNVNKTLHERGERYGSVRIESDISQSILGMMRTDNWYSMPAYMRHSLSMMATKMARIANGDPFYEDNWHDIEGYARLVQENIAQDKSPVASCGADMVAGAACLPDVPEFPYKTGTYEAWEVEQLMQRQYNRGINDAITPVVGRPGARRVGH